MVIIYTITIDDKMITVVNQGSGNYKNTVRFENK